MAASSNGSGPVAFLVLVVLFLAGLSVVRDGSAPAEEAPARALSACIEGAEPPCGPPPGAAASAAPRTGPVLSTGEACRDAGYLCSRVERDGPMRVLRFPDETESVTVRVPAPEHEDPAVARRLQRAAIRGIQAWQGHPFPLRIQERDLGRRADLVVTWVRQLDGSSLGRTRSRYRSQGGETTYRVVDLTLASRSPYDDRRILDARQLELVAAHEMGHALGLPHSEDPQDVMYPTNTATHLTAQDYRTLESLYSLPHGAVIR